MRRSMRVGLGLLATLCVIAACEDTMADDPVAGTATIQLDLEDGRDAAAIRLRVGGIDIDEVRPAREGYRIFVDETESRAVEVIVLGSLRSGPLLHVDVADVTRASSYDAIVLELSDPDGVPLDDPADAASLEWLSPLAP